MRMKKFLILTILFFICSLAVQSVEKPLASERLVKALIQEISGESAFHYTSVISQYDRIQASEGFRESADYIRDELVKMGYQDARIEGWPSNGSTYYYTYRTPIGWKGNHAELWMIIPKKKRLCSFEEIPLTLVKHSHSFQGEAELIDVGAGIGDKAYRDRDVKGKIVLATAYTGDVMREAVLKRGAVGVITWYPPEVRPGYPNMIRYTAIWPRWEERDKIGFGFNVSKQQGWMLKELLAKGEKVVLKADVDTEYYESQVEVVSASFPGTGEPGKEIMIIGHLCHPFPSANDNASGSGGMLEMARALKSMIDKGLVKPPRRTIRFLWVPEFNGTVPYIKAYLERIRNTLAVLNCDMIGEDLHLTGGLFEITCTPGSMPSYLNDVVVNFAEVVESLGLYSLRGSSHEFSYKVLPFGGGSDHYIFNDGALKVPSVMLGHGDRFHHTNLDTPDKVDSSELRRACFIALGTTYYLAAAKCSEAEKMARLITRNGAARFSGDYYDAFGQMLEADNASALHSAYKQVLNVIEHSKIREVRSVYSTEVFASDPEVKKRIRSNSEKFSVLSNVFRKESGNTYEKKCRKLKIKPRPVTLSADEKKMKEIIPVRSKTFICPLDSGYIEERLGHDAIEKIRLPRYSSYEALNYADGKRTVYDIERAVSAEFGPVDIEKVFHFFKVLEKAGLVQLKKSGL